MSMPSRRVFVAAILVAAAGSFGGGSSATAEDPEVTSAREARAAFGLRSDDGTISRLAGSDQDVGTGTWGIPMTAAEAAEVNIPGRMQFVADLNRSGALDYIRSQAQFAGAWIDSRGDGGLVVALTTRSVSVETEIGARMPATNRGLAFVTRSVTESQLRAAAEATPVHWADLAPEVKLLTIAADVSDGRIKLGVAGADLPAASSAIDRLANRLSVPVTVGITTPTVDVDCTSRDNCETPMRAGIRIYKGVIDSYAECTMGFHFVYATIPDIRYMTAGHCGHTGSNTWLHPGLPGNHVIGVETGDLYGPEGQDIMHAGMLDAQADSKVYGETKVAESYWYPMIGEAVCASRGWKAVVTCGSVNQVWVRWYSNTGGYYVWGGDTNIPGIPGDSGSPIYERTSTTLVAIGVLDTATGNFAVVAEALPDMGQGYIYCASC